MTEEKKRGGEKRVEVTTLFATSLYDKGGAKARALRRNFGGLSSLYR
jgi:hypothetical protein